jgi:2-polyprenyl-6-methoxyphenol hydroxylase-like FAD-dependent oxidoreductase
MTGQTRHAVVMGGSVAGLLAAQVIETAGRDTTIAERLLRVMHLLDAPETLFAPSVLRRVLRTRPTTPRAPAHKVGPLGREPRTEVTLERA